MSRICTRFMASTLCWIMSTFQFLTVNFVPLWGPSGCGKSTFLRIVLGQEQQTSGDVLIGGIPVGTPNEERGIVYQRYALFPHLTVLDNVTLGFRLRAGFFGARRNRREHEDRGREMLRRVRLEGAENKFPHELSGGMQQRVAIAQALITRPKMLLMDEPFGALDPGTREQMQVFLLELWEEYGMTIFFVTHDLEEAAYLGTRIIALSQFYSDDRDPGSARGAKIVSDYPLGRSMRSTAVKATAEFGELIQRVRREGFDPEHLQYVTRFNLRHGHSFQTLTREESES